METLRIFGDLNLIQERIQNLINITDVDQRRQLVATICQSVKNVIFDTITSYFLNKEIDASQEYSQTIPNLIETIPDDYSSMSSECRISLWNSFDQHIEALFREDKDSKEAGLLLHLAIVLGILPSQNAWKVS